MKSNMGKEIATKNYFFHFGYDFRKFSLGIYINRSEMAIDFYPFWIGIEWWKVG